MAAAAAAGGEFCLQICRDVAIAHNFQFLDQ